MATPDRFVEHLDGTGTDREESGGKAWALDRLVEFGFEVPAAFVVRADAYRRFAGAGTVAARIHRWSAAAPPVPTEVAAGEAEVLAVFESAPIPTDVAAEVVEHARDLLTDGPVAVRSSATVEDAVEGSAAGQYRSYLGLSDPDDVLTAVRRCWASLWFPAARSYRTTIGEMGVEPAMAVVVQRQIDAEWSGVMFTRDPHGDGASLRIEAVPGLGERLVSGWVTPSDFVVDRRTLDITEASDAAPPFVDDIARLGLRIERRMGVAQDIEWSVAGAKVWVLQTRPITAIGSATMDDDGFDTDGSGTDTFTPEGVAEMLPGVLPPLVWTINRPMLEHAFRRLFDRLGATGAAADRGMLGRFRGRAVLDLDVMRAVAASIPGGSADAVDVAYLGPEPAGAADPPPTGRVSVRALVRNWQSQRQVADEVAVVCTAVSCLQLIEPAAERLTLGRWLAYRRELRDLAWRATAAELAASAAAASAYQSLEMLLRRWLGDAEGTRAAQRVTSGSVARVMVGPSRIERVRAVADAVAAEGMDDAARRRLLDQVAAEFGSMAVYAGPTFAEEPGRVEQLVDAARIERRPVESSTEAIDALADSLSTRRGWRLLRVLSGQVIDLRRRLLVRMACDAVRFLTLREEAKAAILTLGGMERRVIIDGAHRLVRSGHLRSIADVDLVSDREFEEMMVDGDPVSAAELRRRRAALDVARQLPPLPASFAGHPDRARTLPTDGPELHGWAASAGIVQAPARHLRGLEDGDRLEPGEVIVAVSTDPSWTPLLLAAGGVVLEQGGPLSHAAIVARELGVPAVVNVAGALAAIPDGAVVEVDGGRGAVSVVSTVEQATGVS